MGAWLFGNHQKILGCPKNFVTGLPSSFIPWWRRSGRRRGAVPAAEPLPPDRRRGSRRRSAFLTRAQLSASNAPWPVAGQVHARIRTTTQLPSQNPPNELDRQKPPRHLGCYAAGLDGPWLSAAQTAACMGETIVLQFHIDQSVAWQSQGVPYP